MGDTEGEDSLQEYLVFNNLLMVDNSPQTELPIGHRLIRTIKPCKKNGCKKTSNQECGYCWKDCIIERKQKEKAIGFG